MNEKCTLLERQVESMNSDSLVSLDSKLNTLNEVVRDDLTSIDRRLDGLTSTANTISTNIATHSTQVIAELMRMNQSLTEQIFNSGGYTCGGTGGWRHAVYLDMTDTNTNCPSGWQLLTENSKRTCGRGSTGSRTCDSVSFSVSGGPYNQVCGRIRAYQWGLHNAFYGYQRGRNTVDSSYFDGVAVMHGSPKQHIWTFAAGNFENLTNNSPNCPCNTARDVVIPPFVGDDYFCESGYVHPGFGSYSREFRFHSTDTLWDGKDCHSSSTCCSLHNPPYFTKTLSYTTTSDLELRMCHDGSIQYSNISSGIHGGLCETRLHSNKT